MGENLGLQPGTTRLQRLARVLKMSMQQVYHIILVQSKNIDTDQDAGICCLFLCFQRTIITD